MKRRKLLQMAGVSGLALALPLPTMAQTLSTVSLGGGVSLISGAGCNVVVAVGPDSVLVVDGGHADNASMLLAEINRIAEGKPITTLFNTNWRPEHSGLNALLTDIDIIAHENTRLWQGADFYVEWEDKQYTPMPLNAQANTSFYQSGEISLGSETIKYGYLPQAHTDGDIYVHFTNANILVVSDLLGVGQYPTLDYVSGGWIGGMQAASEALIEIADDDTQIVAANGSVQNKSALVAQSNMLDLARESIGNSFRSGWSLEDFKASMPELELGQQWSNSDLFLTQLYRGTWYHVPGRAVRNVI